MNDILDTQEIKYVNKEEVTAVKNSLTYVKKDSFLKELLIMQTEHI